MGNKIPGGLKSAECSNEARCVMQWQCGNRETVKDSNTKTQQTVSKQEKRGEQMRSENRSSVPFSLNVKVFSCCKQSDITNESKEAKSTKQTNCKLLEKRIRKSRRQGISSRAKRVSGDSRRPHGQVATKYGRTR